MTVYWITGGTGLIGRHLVQRLVQEGQRLVVLSRSARTRLQSYLMPNLEAFDFDLATSHLRPLPRCDDDEVVLIALASNITTSRDLHYLSSITQADALGHLRLLDHLKPRLRHIVYASSCTVYGWPSQLPVVEITPLDPDNIYALNKVAMELLLEQARDRWRIPIAVLRIAQVYGPGADPGAAMYKFLDDAHQDRPPFIYVPPDTIRDYCHVSDVVDSIHLAVQKRFDGVLNIGSGCPITLEDLARHCLSVANSACEPVVKINRAVRKNSTWLDISKAQQLLGFNPKIAVQVGVQLEYQRLYKKAPSDQVHDPTLATNLEIS